ncbi:hypothetical protein [Bremerella sp.]|uniref:hypothetical protein n=1 Tax=Bremerella sp. TaxID=2795602 RepID=UPI00391CBE7C
MDAFEHVVASIMQEQGFWVRTAFKVELTKAEKVKIGRPSTPRWEIDVLAYRPGDNILRVIECKSYIDSRGVDMRAFDPETGFAKRFKLFNEPNTRKVVFRRLRIQLRDKEAIRIKPKMILCLAAGKIVNNDLDSIRSHFKKRRWDLFDPEYIQKELTAISESGYENSVASVTAKMLLRNAPTQKA